MLMKAAPRRRIGQQVALRVYGVVFLLVLALLVGLTVAIYQKTFVDVVHVTLETNRVGNQLAPPADVKLRGMIVGEVRNVRSDGEKATVDLALEPQTVGLIPENVTARLLPKTLFGEKYVDLVIPPQPSPARLAEGDVIPQDRSSVAIELERVLDNLMPLLRSIQPEKLNAALSALATALEGRGDKLGKNLEMVNEYFTKLNPRLGTITQDITRLADVTGIYADAAPDLVRTLRNFSVSTQTIAQKAQVYAGFLAGTAGFATTTRQILAENGDRIIQLNAVSRPTLAVLARYSPEYPCLLQSLAESNDFIGRAFANGELHITLEVVQSQAPYRPGEEPRWGEKSGPNCRGLPRPPVPDPGAKLNDGASHGGTSGRAVPWFLADQSSGLAGTAEERAVVDPVVAPVMGVPADQVPDLAALLFGPMARGTAVGHS
jgi:phospholipid/cholesterol/gamma-HCH transport system substrate-binding protein